MNDKMTNIPNPDDDPIARKLTEVAEQTRINSQFAAALEEKLRSAHQPKAGWFSRFSPALPWAAVIVLLGLILSWSIKSLVPVPQPSGNGTPDGFVCPVTQPNGSLPPGTQSSPNTDNPNLYGNGELWTVLQPGGKVLLSPENQRTDGSFETTWSWYLGTEGQLTIEGKRLDGEAAPLQVELAEPFNNYQMSTLIFAAPGCWEITGHVGSASLTFVTEVILATDLATPTPITTPNMVTNGSATPPVVQQGGYDWRQTKLYLNVPLPQSPAQASIYLLKDEQPATMDMALARAREFGIQGDVFQVPGRSADQTGYMVTDGKQRMVVQSAQEYAYYADYATYTSMSGAKDLSDEQAAGIIEAFLKSHGLDFPYKFINPHILPGMFAVLQLTQDGMPVYHDHSMPVRIDFTIGENGQVLFMDAFLADYEPAGTYGIRTAEEAFQQILDQSNGTENGVLETMRSGGVSGAGIWLRSYPDNETITIYGQPASYPSTQPGGAPYAGIGQFTATGNTNGMEAIDSSTYIEATGQFITENGIRTFNVDSWKVTDALEAMPAGSLRQEGDRIILTADDGSGEYMIEDAPAGLPLNTTLDSYLAVHGFLKDGQLQWDDIQYFPAGSGGGGGGGSGAGFYKLNLSGTPVPFPSPTAPAVTPTGPFEYTVVDGDTCSSIANNFRVAIQSIISENNLSSDCLISVGQKLKISGTSYTPSILGQQIEGLRGILMVTIYKQSDGSQHVEYNLYPKSNESPFYYVKLEGQDVQKLEAYHNRPVDIWGTVTGVDQDGMPRIQMERYAVPYPDLQFKNLTGTQKVAELEGERVALFTAEDGTTYVQLTSVGNPDITILGTEGSPVIMQTLAIPGEAFGGYPALRVFDGSVAVNPKDGQPVEFTGSADKFNIIDESVQPNMENYVPPDLTIESVELVYYVPDQNLNRQASGPDAKNLQPVWRFFGHYSDGSQVEFLVQALKQEFLLPELEPHTGPG